MVEDSHIETRIIEYRRREPSQPLSTSPAGEARVAANHGSGDLLAVALTDVLSDGLSMVYSFFEPDEATRSLGTLMVLDHIARARRMGLAYVYLGYWVRGSRKMDYKSRFLPQERLTPDGWARMD
jgi:arginine-tRNA-protein transferase